MRLRVALLAMSAVGMTLTGVAVLQLTSAPQRAAPRAIREASAPLQAAPDPAAGSTPAAAQARQGGPYRSEVAGISIGPADQIPLNDHRASPEPCPVYEQDHTSPEARQVKARRWTVVDEMKAGDYHLVTFVARTQLGTSSMCLRGDGGIALFLDGRLQALVQQGPEAGKELPFRDFPASQLVFLSPLDQAGLRIFNGEFLDAPVADMHFDADGGVRITKRPDVDTFCSGRARVPDIYGIEIGRARRIVARYGWAPMIQKRDESFNAISFERLTKRGITEFDDCSGSGPGYCGFSYLGDAGRLSVTTAGGFDEDYVVAYGVECKY